MKHRYRGGALLLSALLLLSWLAPSARAASPQGDIIIRSAQDLILLARNCALDTWSQGKTVTLACDIDLTNSGFTPIPTFGGTFDGGGHTISGLAWTGSGSNQGLFRYVQAGGVVQRLNVRGSVTPDGSQEAVGGIAGNNAGLISQCAFLGTVRGKTCVGGVAGINQSTGRLADCTASGAVQGSDCTGGICGRNLGTLIGCTNHSQVNTALPRQAHNLEDLELGGALTAPTGNAREERDTVLNGHTDTGGVAGYSSGVTQNCSNTGAVGYPHVGYNVGGIAGRQNGYLTGCNNSGPVRGRKDVGGIVGQAEPSLILNVDSGTLAQLREELDHLNRLIHQALDHSDASSAAISSRLTRIGDCAGAARESSQVLLDHTQDFVDGNVDTLNSLSASVTRTLDEISPALDDLARAGSRCADLANAFYDALDTLAQASDSGGALLDEAGDAMDALRPAGRAIGRAAENLRGAITHLENAVVVDDQAAVEQALGDLTQAVGQFSEAVGGAGSALQAIRAALRDGAFLPEDVLAGLDQLAGTLEGIGSALRRLHGALDTLRANLTLNWSQLSAALGGVSQALSELRRSSSDLDAALESLSRAFDRGETMSDRLGEAMRQLKKVSSAASDAAGLFSSAFSSMERAVDTLAADAPVEFYPLGEQVQAAGSDLYASFSGLSDELSQLNGEVLSAGNQLSGDLRAISAQVTKVFNLLLDAITDLQDISPSLDLSDYLEDTSDEDISGTTLGKMERSQNSAPVDGDRNVGGVVGSMAIEYSMDPEDDVLLQPSLNRTYQTKAVLQDCQNYGAVTAKKDCAGGLTGRMDLGYVLHGENYGPIESTGGSYVGGVAGYSASTIRSSYAKCGLAGSDRVGGIAGEGERIRDCSTIVTLSRGAEWLGAIAGTADLSTGSITGNRYVDTGLAGIDGISYAGCAEPVEYALLQEQAEVPAEFLSFALTLRAGERVVARIPFPYGANPAQLDLPQVPELDGCYGAWPELSSQALTADLTLEAVYTPWLTIVASRETSGKRSLALAEGTFTQAAQLHVTDSAAPVPDALHGASGGAVWDISLAGAGLAPRDAVPLRLLDESGGGTVWQYDQGQWHAVEAVRDGRYLHLTMEGTQGTFCVVPDHGMGAMLPIWAAVAALAAGLTAAVLLRRRHTKKKAHAARK